MTDLRSTHDLPCRKGRLQWALSPRGDLTVWGRGTMADYTDRNPPPWAPFAQEIRTLTLEDGVANLGARAFRNCQALKRVWLGPSVTYLGTGSLENCAALERLDSPWPLVHYRQPSGDGQICLRFGQHALRGIPLLWGRWGKFYCRDGVLLDYLGRDGAVEIPQGIREIGPMAFEGVAITHVRFPASLERIGAFAFRSTDLSALELPATLAQVDSHAFADTPVEEVRLGAQRIRIHETAFRNTPVAEFARKIGGKWPQRYSLDSFRPALISPAQALRTRMDCPFGTDWFNSKKALERHLRLGNQVIRLRLDRKRNLVLEVQSMALNHWCDFYTQFLWPCQGQDGAPAVWKTEFLDHTGDYLRRYSTRELRPRAGEGSWEWFTLPRLSRRDSPVPMELLGQWLRVHPDYLLLTPQEQAQRPHTTDPR